MRANVPHVDIRAEARARSGADEFRAYEPIGPKPLPWKAIRELAWVFVRTVTIGGGALWWLVHVESSYP
jgi:hypothetical protein